MKNLKFVSYKPEMFCGMLKHDWSESEANYHFLGVPLDISSTYRTGSRYGPDKFRQILQSENFECTTESGLDLTRYFQIKDWGNVGIISTNLSKSIKFICEGVFDLIQRNLSFLVFGGDHSTTIGCSLAFEKTDVPFYVIYFDAHLDLYDEVMESELSHGCTLRRITEMKGFQGATVLGYRDFTRNQIEYASSNDLTLYSTKELLQLSDLYAFGLTLGQKLAQNFERIYISVDLDILDPSFAPGVNNPVAGGLSTRDLMTLLMGTFKGTKSLQNVNWDITEFNPLYDHSEITSFTILKLFVECLGVQALD